MRNIPIDLANRYEQEGWWTQDTVGQLLAHGLQTHPDIEFQVHSSTRPWLGTFSNVERTARRLAAGLRARGVGPGDAIAFQLPNWMEAAVSFWASALLGAVVVPIVHFYGRKELEHILTTVRPRVFISAEQFGRMTYQRDLCSKVPIVGLVGRDFDELLAPDPMLGSIPTDPRNPALIAFTSGTTSDPKGVIHSHQTLCCEARQFAEGLPPDRGNQLTVAPVGHFIGMINAFLLPVLEGTPVNLADIWDPAHVLELMRGHGLTVGGGPPYFITSLLDHPDFQPEYLQHLKYAGLGGSAVPTAVTQRLTDLGIIVFRAYGSTEHPSITRSPYTAAEDKRLFTDGKPEPGVEIRLASDGEIYSRGPDLCLGYTDDALTRSVFDVDGWYRTGDVGVIDDDGYLTITDRKADFIIRAGENVSALEVEEALLTMPAIAEAAVVAIPDRRLGERAAAVLRVKHGHVMPTLQQTRRHFDRLGIARQKWPEELYEVDDYPRTASGKVQKHLLRKAIAAEQLL
ncbi:AMP-binding protein [Mycobacterium conspicuum]|uniref:Long-chain-fatty-acid--CoA ligase n=1 Tax=Mycobacterium conspicuum TaxID=44010 RepID=A0A1X1T199_9MYCO|nr:AMP-binding protein [Mycobacterium conspicuum]ORV38031.1 AMP-dependent synthetase [Mycobacterium conspicuum]BBZ41526.1 long-chain-fatty-acid--CoA ligase [Mycobacterium conspicuum]